jgi:hypothetical protein
MEGLEFAAGCCPNSLLPTFRHMPPAGGNGRLAELDLRESRPEFYLRSGLGDPNTTGGQGGERIRQPRTPSAIYLSIGKTVRR